MAKINKEYIETKIANCKVLIETATSQPQRDVYREYLDFWESHIVAKPKKEKPKEPEIVIEPVIVPELLPIPEPEPIPNGKVKCSICGREFSPQGIAAHERACKKAKLERELEDLKAEGIEPDPELVEKPNI